MLRGIEQSVLKQAKWYLPLHALVVAMAASKVDAGEALSLESIKARINRQNERIESLHLRIRRETTMSLDPKVAVGWSDWLSVPPYLGTDEVLVAFKGVNRYWRLLALDYRPTVVAELPPQEASAPQPFIDNAKACNEITFFERTLVDDAASQRVAHRCFQHRSAPLSEAHDAFGPTPYLMNVGLAVPDPTGEDEARRNLQQMHFLPDLFELCAYAMSEETEVVDEAPCLVLERAMSGRLPGNNVAEDRSVSDKLWLDPEHGLALRQRETHFDGRLVRVVNSDFVEMLPGLWLPRESQTEWFVPSEAPEEYRNRPLLVRHMRLLFWVVNQVPDDLFDVALTPLRFVPDFDLTTAYRRRLYPLRGEGNDRSNKGEMTGEVWAVNGVGRREAHYRNGELSKLVVDTPRWHFLWSPAWNRVLASPSRLGDPGVQDAVVDRAYVFRRYERHTAVFACKKERLADQEVDKVTCYFPREIASGGRCPIHEFHPKVQLKTPCTEFLTREHWFDPKTGLRVQRLCGCIRDGKCMKWDYPPPESVPRELFNFQVPRDAALELNDPDLGRPILSEGQTELE